MAAGHAPTLRELQRWMAARIVNGADDAPDVDALIATPARGDARERLRVYAGGYPVRIEEALKENFPAIAHLVGESAFHGLVHRFAAAVPLPSYNLSDAGVELPRFLRDDRLTEGLPFLPDLARLEWHIACAFHAFDEPVLHPTALARWTAEQWERAVLRFQPWVALVTSEWPIREIWDCREMPIEEIDIDLNNRPDCVLVLRAGHAVVCESLDNSEANALAALIDGQTLGSVVATLAARGEDPAVVSTWFAHWMTLRAVVGCDVRL